MTWFYASSVSVTNGQTVVSVNAGDDIQLAQSAGGLIIGTQPAVEIKRTFLDASNHKKIELTKPWPYGTQTNQPAMAFPTDGDLAAATAVLKQLIDGFTLATQAEAQAGTENTKPMTALRVKQAMDVLLGTASKLTATTSSRDATEGRALRVRDFGVGSNAVQVSPAELDGLTANGFYSVVGASQAPTTDPYEVQHIQFDANSAKQIAYEAGTTLTRVFVRVKGGAVWQPWRKIYNSSDVVGLVGFAGGVNTGAIIERGANANGEYAKFADGTLICTINFQGSPSLTSYSGGIYAAAAVGWNFPATFVNIPVISGSGSDSLTVGWLSSSNTTAGATLLAYFTRTAAPAVVLFNAVAIGRWRN